MEDIIKEHFGDLKLIDLMYSNEERDEARLVLMTSGYIDGSKEIQTALVDKMEGYLSHIQSEEFKKDYPQKNVIIKSFLMRCLPMLLLRIYTAVTDGVKAGVLSCACLLRNSLLQLQEMRMEIIISILINL